jgi:hypothetical protein
MAIEQWVDGGGHRWPSKVIVSYGDDEAREVWAVPVETLEAERTARREDRNRLTDELVAAERGEVAAEQKVAALIAAVEDYLLWEPCKKGHAEAHRKLSEFMRSISQGEGPSQTVTPRTHR